MSQGFPKSARLLKRKDFRLVYDTGTPYRNAGFHLFVLRRATRREEPCLSTRIGLTTTRSLGGAVARNRLRRWAREAFRPRRGRLAPGCDLVLNFHRRLAKAPRREFDRLFENVLEKARLLESRETGR